MYATTLRACVQLGHSGPGEVQVDRARLLPRRERAGGRVRPVVERVTPEPRGLAARRQRDRAAGRAPLPRRHQTRPPCARLHTRSPQPLASRALSPYRVEPLITHLSLVIRSLIYTHTTYEYTHM